MSKMLDDEYFNQIGMYAEIVSIGESVLQSMGKYNAIQLDNYQVNKKTRADREGSYPPYYYTEIVVYAKVTVPITILKPVGLNIFKWKRSTKTVDRYEQIFNYSSSKHYWLRGFNANPDYLYELRHNVVGHIERAVQAKLDIENNLIAAQRKEIEKKLLGR